MISKTEWLKPLRLTNYSTRKANMWRDGQGGGNIVALIDSSGNVVVKYEYDAWGKHEVYDGSGTKITQKRTSVGVL